MTVCSVEICERKAGRDGLCERHRRKEKLKDPAKHAAEKQYNYRYRRTETGKAATSKYHTKRYKTGENVAGTARFFKAIDYEV
jgi:hypothetical protein